MTSLYRADTMTYNNFNGVDRKGVTLQKADFSLLQSEINHHDAKYSKKLCLCLIICTC